MLRKTLVFLLLLCIGWSFSFWTAEANLGIPLKVYPRDETEHDLSFMEYKLQLLKVIASKDLDGLLPLVSPEIHVSFGKESGHHGLISLWNLGDNGSSPFWSTLDNILKMGCVRQTLGKETIFVAPYVYADFPGADGGWSMIVTGHSVRVRETPSLTAKVLETLDYDVVNLADPKSFHPNLEWAKISTPSGKTGYIRTTYLRAPLDYRAGFQKIHGKWQMIFFVSGD